MPGAHNGDVRYEVRQSQAVGKLLRQLLRRATRRGQGQAFLSALRRIIVALRRNPHEVGEPLYWLAGLRLHMRTVVVAPLVVDFGISEDHPIVYIKTSRLLSAPGS